MFKLRNKKKNQFHKFIWRQPATTFAIKLTNKISKYIKCVATRENLSLRVGEQQRSRSNCTFTQTDQHLFICFLESIISKMAPTKFQYSSLSLAEETGLSLALSETPKTGFVASRPKCNQRCYSH